MSAIARGGGRPTRAGRVNSYHQGRERVWVGVGGPGAGAVKPVSMGENMYNPDFVRFL